MGNSVTKEKKLSKEQQQELLGKLKERFMKNMHRHEGMKWDDVQSRLESDAVKLWTLGEMERTGGEPDVVARGKDKGEYVFYDCAPQSPAGRRNVCYDPESLQSRKTNKPPDSAIGMAEDMGIEILSEEQYRELQKLGEFDTKTSTWIQTPADIRKLGGALFADRRYNNIFVYHNGAESYYSSRGFRGMVRV
jgi:hypothetical protein